MKSFFKTIGLTLLFLPLAVSAQYTTLVELPAFDGIQDGGFDSYINAVYAMFISIAALLAVVKIIVAGVKYMFSDIVTQKSDAKNDIKGALIGLVVIVAAVVILTVINPNLTRFNLDTQALSQSAPRQDPTTYNHITLDNGVAINIDQHSPEQIALFISDCQNQRKGKIITRNDRQMQCETGSAVINTISGATGNDVLDRAECETGSGFTWDNIDKVCRDASPYQYASLPENLEGLDTANSADVPFLNELCTRQHGPGWLFNAEDENCRIVTR